MSGKRLEETSQCLVNGNLPTLVGFSLAKVIINKAIKLWEKERENMQKETQSQTVRTILELCEAFGMPDNAITIIKKKCWHLADSDSTEGKGNSYEERIDNYDI